MIKYNEEYFADLAKVLPSIPNIKKLYGHSVLITGGTGMICSSVADILLYLNTNCDAKITIILAGRSKSRLEKRFSKFKEGKDYFFAEYDATTDVPPAVSADYIIHGASNAHPAAYTDQPVETILANISGLNSLLHMAVEKKSRRVLYISSSEVYGNRDEQRPYEENDYGYLDILNQRASYPSSKRAAETLCVAYGNEYDLDTVMVRPGHIYGPTITASDNRASAQFTRNAVQNQNIVMKSAGLQRRSYCYTLDCASAILAVLLNGKRGEAYNISNSNSVVTISELAEALAKVSGTKVVYEQPSEREKAGYNLMTDSSLDSKKLEALGWSAVFSLECGTRKTVQMYELG